MSIRRRIPAMEQPAPNDPTPISAVMTHGALSVDIGLSVEALAGYLIEHHASAVAVTALGQIVGIASTTDLLRELRDRHVGEEQRWARPPKACDGFHATRIARAKVGEIMTPFAFALPDTASVQQAAALMAYEGVSQLPVMGASGRFVGMLSSLDVMGWLARQSTFTPPLPDVVPRAERADGLHE